MIEDTEVFIYGPCIELRMKGQHESELGTLIQQTNWPQIRDYIDKELGEPTAHRTLRRLLDFLEDDTDQTPEKT